MAIMDETSMMRFFVNCFSELAVTLVSQLNPILLARVDPKKLISAFSYVADGKRVEAPDWELAPGWRDEDVRIGKDYSALLQESFQVDSIQALAGKSSKDLVGLWNSDDVTTKDPYNNPRLKAARQTWSDHMATQGANIPIAVVAESDEVPAVCMRHKSKRTGRSYFVCCVCQKS
jgi:hypothetical protein